MKSKKNLSKNQSTTDTLLRQNIQITKEQLDKKFDQLYEESSKWKIKKQQMKQQRQLAKSLQQQKICTFKPSVNPQLFFQSKQSFLKRQRAWMNKKQHKVQALIQETQKKIKKQCSFQPKLQKDQKHIQKIKVQNNYNNIHKSALRGLNKNSYKIIHNNRIANKSHKYQISEPSMLQSSRNSKYSALSNTLKHQNIKQDQSQFVNEQDQIKIEDLNDNKQRLSTDCDLYKQESKQHLIENSNQEQNKIDTNKKTDQKENFQEIEKVKIQNKQVQDFQEQNKNNQEKNQAKVQDVPNEQQAIGSDNQCI